MELNELRLLDELCPEHPDLQALRDEHLLFSKQLEKLEKKAYLTPVEEQEAREIKKQKLDRKTKLVGLLNQYSTKEG